MINIVGTLYMVSRNVYFVFYVYKSWKTQTTDVLGLPFRYMWIFKQQISLCIVFIKQNSLKSDLILILYLSIPCFSGFMFSRLLSVQVFLGPGFSEFSLFRFQLLRVQFFMVQVQVLEAAVSNFLSSILHITPKDF